MKSKCTAHNCRPCREMTLAWDHHALSTCKIFAPTLAVRIVVSDLFHASASFCSIIGLFHRDHSNEWARFQIFPSISISPSPTLSALAALQILVVLPEYFGRGGSFEVLEF